MKKIRFLSILFVLVLMSAKSLAQGMSEADMQNMMIKAQEAQACFEQLDPSVMTNIEAEGKRMQKELQALCSAGDRSGAMKQAMAFAKEFESSSDVKAMRKCAQIMEGMMGAFDIPDYGEDFSANDTHVCDDIWD